MHIIIAHDESLDHFHDHFIHLCYEFFGDDIDWNVMKENFEFICHISMNLVQYESFESLSTHTSYGTLKSLMGEVVVPSESSYSPHQTCPFT